MKTQIKISTIAILTIAMAFVGCESVNNQEADESLTPTLIKAYSNSGFTEGKIEEVIEVSIEFTHPYPGLEVKDVIIKVNDNFSTEYLLIVDNSDRKDTYDSLTVNYDITEAGVHSLIFLYQFGDKKEFLGQYVFAINN